MCEELIVITKSTDNNLALPPFPTRSSSEIEQSNICMDTLLYYV